MPEPEGDRQQEPEEQRQRNPLVPVAHGEELRGEAAPGDGLRVELLDSLPGPGTCALGRKEGGALVGRDGHHEDVREDTADGSASLQSTLACLLLRVNPGDAYHLHCECAART